MRVCEYIYIYIYIYIHTHKNYIINIYVKGSIEVQIATMSKQDRANIDEVYVCGFVPAHMLPKKMPWSLDPFIHPLITEIEDALIDG